MKPIIEKKHKLSDELYEGFVIVAFTLCIKNRTPVLDREVVFDKFTKILIDAAKHGCLQKGPRVNLEACRFAFLLMVLCCCVLAR